MHSRDLTLRPTPSLIPDHRQACTQGGPAMRTWSFPHGFSITERCITTAPPWLVMAAHFRWPPSWSLTPTPCALVSRIQQAGFTKSRAECFMSVGHKPLRLNQLELVNLPAPRPLSKPVKAGFLEVRPWPSNL